MVINIESVKQADYYTMPDKKNLTGKDDG